MATVIKTWRSSPRPVGSGMIISSDLEIVGSVSGGCVEGAVSQTALEVLKTGQARVLDFGVSNEDAWNVGLSCGGAIRVLVEPHLSQKSEFEKKIWTSLTKGIVAGENVTLVTKLDGSSEHGIFNGSEFLHPPSWPQEIIAKTQMVHTARQSEVITFQEESFFANCITKPNHLIVIGAAHISTELVRISKVLGYRITVIDPRGLFTDSLRQVCKPDQLHRAWPAEILPTLELDDQAYVVLLTHDPKIDDQAMQIVLKSKAKYIGALGSTRTHAKRMARLADAGYSAAEIARIHGPIGLDIKAKLPAEIALSIAAEMTSIMRAD